MRNSVIFMIISGILIVILYATHIVGILGFVGLVFIVFIIGIVWYENVKAKVTKKRNIQLQNALETELGNIEGFNISKKLIGTWGFIAIDDPNECIVVKQGGDSVRKYPYSDILSCEILVDDVTTYHKSTSRTVGRAIVGGVIAGGAGAVVGGVTAKGEAKKTIRSIDFKIVFKDVLNPNYIVRLYPNPIGTTKLLLPQETLNILNNWKDTISIIIDKIDSHK